MTWNDRSKRVGSIEFSLHPRAFVLIFYRMPVNLLNQVETKLDGANAWHQWRRKLIPRSASNFRDNDARESRKDIEDVRR